MRKEVNVTILDDEILENTFETFTVSLTLPGEPRVVLGSHGSATVSITDDDSKYKRYRYSPTSVF